MKRIIQVVYSAINAPTASENLQPSTKPRDIGKDERPYGNSKQL